MKSMYFFNVPKNLTLFLQASNELRATSKFIYDINRCTSIWDLNPTTANVFPNMICAASYNVVSSGCTVSFFLSLSQFHKIYIIQRFCTHSDSKKPSNRWISKPRVVYVQSHRNCYTTLFVKHDSISSRTNTTRIKS